jgi:hypothetical protein
LEIVVARKDPEVTKSYDRARKAAERAGAKRDQAESRQARARLPGKTPFASFVRVRNPRLAGQAEQGAYFFDLAVGQFTFQGCRYDANAGSLQLTTCPLEKRRPKVNGAYFVSTVRPIIIAAIEKWRSEVLGRPYRFPKAARFTPQRRTQRGKKELVQA